MSVIVNAQKAVLKERLAKLGIDFHAVCRKSRTDETGHKVYLRVEYTGENEAATRKAQLAAQKIIKEFYPQASITSGAYYPTGFIFTMAEY